MNLVRNHIMYYKNKMVEQYGTDYEKYPEIFYREMPPKVSENYMARAGEIKDGAAQALEYYISDPNFFYLESFAQCATRMMNIINDRKKEPGQVQGDGQLSLFQFGMETGQCR